MSRGRLDRLRWRSSRWAGATLFTALLAASLPASSTAGAKGPDGAALGSTRPPEPAGLALAEPTAATQHRGVAAFRTLPVIFEANQGQADRSVRFLSRGSGYSLFLTDSEAVLVLVKSLAPGASRLAMPNDVDSTETAVLHMELVGANLRPRTAGLEKLPGTVNYLIGDDSKRWQTKIPTYAKVRYERVYPGVDLIYHGTQGRLEYDFVLAPGASPGAIALEFEGAQRLAVSADGDLVLAVPSGELRMHKPNAYRAVDGTAAGGRDESCGLDFAINFLDDEVLFILLGGRPSLDLRFPIPGRRSSRGRAANQDWSVNYLVSDWLEVVNTPPLPYRCHRNNALSLNVEPGTDLAGFKMTAPGILGVLVR